jgi:hypothetical protein
MHNFNFSLRQMFCTCLWRHYFAAATDRANKADWLGPQAAYLNKMSGLPTLTPWTALKQLNTVQYVVTLLKKP